MKLGRTIPLSLARKMIGDFLALSQDIPLAHGERRIDIRPLREAMLAAPRPRPKWLPLFFKAYAIVAAKRPALRRHYVKRPWPHLYENHENVGSIVIARRLEEDTALFYLTIHAPETLWLWQIEQILKDAQEKPITEILAFHRQVRLTRTPEFFRRCLLRTVLHWGKERRARKLGTFGMSVLADMGIANLSTLVPWTTMIHYTPFDEQGSMLLRIALDHRVIDGLEAAYALREMEEVLNGPILREFRYMIRIAGTDTSSESKKLVR